mmetsp:Transcript_54170/g.118100  ORF Transcript_54170/g.118100 Transcript_54170/m.118100 type:complete len:271 (+) Transcript_54170:553-1365(+)
MASGAAHHARAHASQGPARLVRGREEDHVRAGGSGAPAAAPRRHRPGPVLRGPDGRREGRPRCRRGVAALRHHPDHGGVRQGLGGPAREPRLPREVRHLHRRGDGGERRGGPKPRGVLRARGSGRGAPRPGACQEFPARRGPAEARLRLYWLLRGLLLLRDGPSEVRRANGGAHRRGSGGLAEQDVGRGRRSHRSRPELCVLLVSPAASAAAGFLGADPRRRSQIFQAPGRWPIRASRGLRWSRSRGTPFFKGGPRACRRLPQETRRGGS